MSGGKILFISNGYGEDTIACSIISHLADKISGEEIAGFPLVGEGKAYKNAEIAIAAPTRNLPSGGLMPENYARNLWTDLGAGLARLTIHQVKAIKAIKNQLKAVVAVGDTYPVLLGGMFGKRPLIFVGTAKSDYFVPYSMVERKIFRKFCQMVFPRDKQTADTLKQHGINAHWVGNAMMDNLNITGDRFGIPDDRRIITILPGSRSFAYTNFPVMLKAVDIISNESNHELAFIAHLAASTDVNLLGISARQAGFMLEEDNSSNLKKLVSKSCSILLLSNCFGDSINSAYLVIGQAGTGNEQAAGLGKPVVAFDSGDRKKLSWYRARQKGLLGDALAVVNRDPESLAKKVLQLLDDKNLYSRMSQTGRERMGPPGGAGKMADYIYSCL